MSRVLRAGFSTGRSWPLAVPPRGLDACELSVLPRKRPRAPGEVTSSAPGSLELVDFSPVSALKEIVAPTQTF